MTQAEADTITQYAQSWQEEYINELCIKDAVVVTHILLLSYEITSAAILLAHSKLLIQKELLKITTLDIGSTLKTKDMLYKNDTSIMKKAIELLEASQERVQVACGQFAKFFPQLINLNPEITKVFIKNIQQAVFDWAKQQNEIIDALVNVKKEFIADAQLVTKITHLFENIINNMYLEKNPLLEGATSVIDMYKKVETTLFQFTKARQKSIENLEDLLVFFFKKHYGMLYAKLQCIPLEELSVENHAPLLLPNPDLHFIITTH